jgi:hypothetical protein
VPEETIVIELLDEKIENHELSHPHHDGRDCDAKIAVLEARIAELEGGHHVHDEEFEEAGEPTIEEV